MCGFVSMNSIRVENVVRRSPMRLIPASGRFETEADADIQVGPQLDGILHKARKFKRSPAERSRGRNDGERRDVALEKARQASERRLSILILRQIVICLNALQPDSRFDLMDAVREAT